MCFLAAIGALALILVACFAMSRALHGIFRIIRCYQDLKAFRSNYGGSLGLAGSVLRMLYEEHITGVSKRYLHEEIIKVRDRLDALEAKGKKK